MWSWGWRSRLWSRLSWCRRRWRGQRIYWTNFDASAAVVGIASLDGSGGVDATQSHARRRTQPGWSCADPRQVHVLGEPRRATLSVAQPGRKRRRRLNTGSAHGERADRDRRSIRRRQDLLGQLQRHKGIDSPTWTERWTAESCTTTSDWSTGHRSASRVLASAEQDLLVERRRCEITISVGEPGWQRRSRTPFNTWPGRPVRRSARIAIRSSDGQISGRTKRDDRARHRSTATVRRGRTSIPRRGTWQTRSASPSIRRAQASTGRTTSARQDLRRESRRHRRRRNSHHDRQLPIVSRLPIASRASERCRRAHDQRRRGDRPTRSVVTAGSWAPDLIELIPLSRAAEHSFSWTNNGTPIAGATASAITASSPGNDRMHGDRDQPRRLHDPDELPAHGRVPAAAATAAPATAPRRRLRSPRCLVRARQSWRRSRATASQGRSARRSWSGPCTSASETTRILAVTADTGKKHGGKPKTKTVIVTVARSTVTVPAGGSVTAKIPLNTAGARLLARFQRLPVTLSFTGSVTATQSVVYTLPRLRVTVPDDTWSNVNPGCGAACSSTPVKVPITGLPKARRSWSPARGGVVPSLDAQRPQDTGRSTWRLSLGPTLGCRRGPWSPS